jgi:hypothetical protein
MRWREIRAKQCKCMEQKEMRWMLRLDGNREASSNCPSHTSVDSWVSVLQRGGKGHSALTTTPLCVTKRMGLRASPCE